MKKWMLFFALLAVPVVAMAADMWHWSGDTRLTNNTAADLTGMNFEHAITTPQSSLYPKHIVWCRDLGYPGYRRDLLYRRKTVSGWTQEVPITTTEDIVSKEGWFSLASDPTGNYVYVTFQDERTSPVPQIYLIRSTNGGVNWLTSVRISPDLGEYYYESDIAATSGGKVFAVWQQGLLYNPTIITFARSDDYGITWVITNQIGAPANNRFPSIACDPFGNNAHVAWMDWYGGGGNQYIKYRRYNVSLYTWEDLKTLVTRNYPVYPPAIDCSKDGGQKVHVVWYEGNLGTPGKKEIFYNRSTNNGGSWGSATNLSGYTALESAFPTLSTGFGNSNVVDVVWREYDDYGASQSWWRRSYNGGGSWGSKLQFVTTGTNFGGHVTTDVNNCADIVFRSARPPGHNDSEMYHNRYYCSPYPPTTIPGGVEDFNSRMDLKPYEASAGGIHITPNPVVRNEARISVALSRCVENKATASIFDIQGRLLRTLSLDKADLRGAFAYWDGRDASGRQVGKGVYLVAVHHEGKNEVGRIVVAR